MGILVNMATEDVNNDLPDVEKLNLDNYEVNHKLDNTCNNNFSNWGFDTEELYKLALNFYKEKEGKAIHLSYTDKLKLVALTKQVTFGTFDSEKMPTVGLLDVVGNDRRQAWQSLGDMTSENAMKEFIHRLDNLCLLFKTYVQAHQTEKEEKEKL